MKNMVNLGQQFLSRNGAQLTFTEGKVSLRIGGGEVYLEEKGYSRVDGRTDAAQAAAGPWDRVPPEERDGAWTALLPPRERERLLGRPRRGHGRGSPSHLRRPLSESDCVICLLEEVSGHRQPETSRESHQDGQAGGAQRIGTIAGGGMRTTTGEGRPQWKTRHHAGDSTPGGGRAGGGRERAATEGRS